MRHKAQSGRGKSSSRAVPALALIALAAVGGAAAPQAAVRHDVALGVHALVAADSCDSVLIKSRVGWATREYKAALRQWDGAIPFPDTHLFMTLTELAARLQFEGPLDFFALGDDPPVADFDVPVVGSIATFGVHGLYSFEYDARGRLGRPRVLVSSLSERLDSAVVRAVRAASDSGALLPLPATATPDSIELRLTIGTSVRADSLAVTGPLFRVRLPVFDQVTQPWSDGKRTVSPLYPVGEREAGIEGQVDVELVVREDGSVDPRSIMIPRATTTSFAQQVYDAVLKSRFTPARIAGCPVPSLITQPFTFTIAR